MLLIFISGGLLTLFAILALLWYIFAGSCCILVFFFRDFYRNQTPCGFLLPKVAELFLSYVKI